MKKGRVKEVKKRERNEGKRRQYSINQGHAKKTRAILNRDIGGRLREMKEAFPVEKGRPQK